MKRTRHSPDQIIAKLREADALLATGASIGQVVSGWKSARRPFTAGATSTAA